MAKADDEETWHGRVENWKKILSLPQVLEKIHEKIHVISCTEGIDFFFDAIVLSHKADPEMEAFLADYPKRTVSLNDTRGLFDVKHSDHTTSDRTTIETPKSSLQELGLAGLDAVILFAGNYNFSMNKTYQNLIKATTDGVLTFFVVNKLPNLEASLESLVKAFQKEGGDLYETAQEIIADPQNFEKLSVIENTVSDPCILEAIEKARIFLWDLQTELEPTMQFYLGMGVVEESDTLTGYAFSNRLNSIEEMLILLPMINRNKRGMTEKDMKHSLDIYNKTVRHGVKRVLTKTFALQQVQKKIEPEEVVEQLDKIYRDNVRPRVLADYTEHYTRSSTLYIAPVPRKNKDRVESLEKINHQLHPETDYQPLNYNSAFTAKDHNPRYEKEATLVLTVTAYAAVSGCIWSFKNQFQNENMKELVEKTLLELKYKYFHDSSLSSINERGVADRYLVEEGIQAMKGRPCSPELREMVTKVVGFNPDEPDFLRAVDYVYAQFRRLVMRQLKGE